MKKLLIILCLVCAAGCTEKVRAKKFGGNYTKKLTSGHKLVNVTWKDSNLWVLTRPMKETETPETYTFQEDSNMGLMEGTITIIETKE